VANFTEKELKSLPNPESGKRKVYHDSKIKGLSVRVTSNGIKSFIVRANIDGKTKTVTLGRHPSMKIDVARKLAIDALSTFGLGVNPNDKKRDKRLKSITLEQTMNDYITSRNKNLKQKTISDYRILFDGFLSEWKNKELKNITRDMVEKKHTKIGEKSIYRANGTMRLLRALFNYAGGAYENSKGEPIIVHNPVQRINHNKAWFREKSRDNIVQPNDLKAWFTAVKDLPNHHINAIRNNISETVSDYLIFILFTGLRQSEAAGLLWKDVDFNNNLFTVRDTKNHTDHTLPLTNYTYGLLKNRQNSTTSNFVFSGNNPEKSIVNPYKQIKKIREESGVHFTMHDLRRTFATIADILNVQYHVIKRLMNHSNNDVTSLHYIKSSKEKLREPMQQITLYILDQVK
jgi:integrase